MKIDPIPTSRRRDPKPVKTTIALVRRFRARLNDLPASNGCLLWPGARSENGYGVIRYAGRGGGYVFAHRLAWVISNGPIPDGMFVCHRCDNPPCVEPSHLFLGTAADNVADMWSKGRMVPDLAPPNRIGSANHFAKLNEADVVDIFHLAEGGMTSERIAARFDVSTSTICAILRRATWRHVALPVSLGGAA